VSLYVKAVRALAARLCEALDASHGPLAWQDITEALRLLAELIPQETVVAMLEYAERQG
jgi:hypothetical protein